jgi:hypothetical protein
MTDAAAPAPPVGYFSASDEHLTSVELVNASRNVAAE